MSDVFRDVVSELKYLSFIQKNQKMSTKDHTVYKNDWYDFIFRRWVQPESRSDTVNYLETTIDKAFRYISECDSIERKKTLVACLQESKDGMKNLRYTYQHDAFMKGKIDSILLEIDTKIDEFSCESKENPNPDFSWK